MSKKGMELTLNTVIIAIILIIVLVVVVFIFTHGASIFGKSLQGLPCTQRGTSVIPAYCKQTNEACKEGLYVIQAPGCPDEKSTGPCCVPLKS